MKKNYILYLGSSSASRQMLLNESKIPFMMVGHTADEESVDASLSLEDQVLFIAQLKMQYVILQSGTYDDEIRFVLTADTMGCDSHGTVHGKPKDKDDARSKIKMLGQSARVATGFCIEKRVWKNNTWQVIDTHSEVVTTKYVFKVPESRIEDYFDNSPALVASGAIAVEGYGLQFLEKVEGSFTAIVGLPLFEVRAVLEQFGFFE